MIYYVTVYCILIASAFKLQQHQAGILDRAYNKIKQKEDQEE